MENTKIITEEESEEEREKKIQRFMKKVLKFLKEHECLCINREISGEFVMTEYRLIPRNQ